MKVEIYDDDGQNRAFHSDNVDIYSLRPGVTIIILHDEPPKNPEEMTTREVCDLIESAREVKTTPGGFPLDYLKEGE